MLRDHHCRTPWCEAGIAHADHITPHRAGGRTRYHNGQGLSERCNYLKDLPGFTTRRLTRAEIRDRAATDPDFATRIGAHTHITELTTPTGHTYTSIAPPAHGWTTWTRDEPDRAR